MSLEEKSTWIYAVTAIAAPAVYIVYLLGRFAGTPVDSIDYAGAMLWAIGLSIVASIVANILVGMFSSGEARRRDERDAHIERLGYVMGFYTFSVLMVGPMLMAIAEVPHFWIANTIYLAFALTAFLYSALKIVAYRRGL